MADTIAIAHYLLHLAGHEPEPEVVTHLRLQKLLYYVQGWAIGATGRTLFDEELQAWPHGPVVVSVYEHFKKAGSCPLAGGARSHWRSLSRDEMSMIEGVWQAYKQYSASALREMTHREAPWIEARKGLRHGSRKASPVQKSVMQAYFGRVWDKVGDDPLHRSRAAMIDESRWQIARGQSIRLSDMHR